MAGKFIFEIPLPFYDIFRGIKTNRDIRKVVIFSDTEILEELYPVNKRITCDYFYIPFHTPKLYIEIVPIPKHNMWKEIEAIVYVGFTKKRKKLHISGKKQK